MTKRKTALQILAEWLKQHGSDGLVNPEAGCCCLVDYLQPCDSWMGDCVPGYRVRSGCDPERYDCDYDYCLSPVKDAVCPKAGES